MDDLAREVLALHGQGHGPREIERRLAGTRYACGKSTVSRIIRAHSILPPTPRPSRRPVAEQASAEEVATQPDQTPRQSFLAGLPEPDPEELAERDPAKLRERDWRHYETSVLQLRACARSALQRNDLKAYRDFEAAARVAQVEANKLRPPTPPDPETDPTYRTAAAQLVAYLSELVKKAERGEPLPPRELPPTIPVAATR